MEAPKPIPGTSKAGEPAYKKPKLPPRAEIVAYYRAVAPLLLKQARGRVLNLFRCTAGHCFFQRNRNHPDSGGAFGPPIRFVPIDQKNGRTEDYLYVDGKAGLVACAEADAVEFHGWGSLASDVERPDRIALDLDPGEGAGFEEVKAAASMMRGFLAELGLESFAMLTGGKGVHVIVPLLPEAAWPQVRGFARSVCIVLAQAEPERFTVALRKSERRGRIFLDYLRNQRTATAILPYSLRARADAPVAAPVSWDELEALDRSARFTITDLATLVHRAADLRSWGKARQRLPRI